MTAPKFHIEWMDQHGYWKHYQTKHNQADTFRVMKRRAEATMSLVPRWEVMTDRVEGLKG